MRRQAVPVTAALACLGLVTLTAALIALRTRYNAHPDEYMHADAIAYFEHHWWPPDLNADGLSYDPTGSSRVYYGEIVYLLYGRLAAILRAPEQRLLEAFPQVEPVPAAPGPYHTFLPQITTAVNRTTAGRSSVMYRLFNVALLPATLAIVWAAGRRHAWARAAGMGLLCLPQVTYTYAYGNSDAWGLSVSLVLFAFVLAQRRVWSSAGKAASLGVLLGLLAVSKPTFWPALAFILPIGARNAWEDYGPWLRDAKRTEALRAGALALGAALIVAAPLRIVYPLSQGDYRAREREMREARSLPGFQPNAPAFPSLRWAARGVPFSAVIGQPEWYSDSLKSFYGVFGYATIWLEGRVYAVALGMWMLNLGATLWAGFRPGRTRSRSDRWLLAAAGATAGLCVVSSLYFSWIVDYQAQGRYLFGALAPLAVLAFGMLDHQPRWVRAVQWGSWALLCILSVAVLWRYILLNPDVLR
jgi:hypothetical protein